MTLLIETPRKKKVSVDALIEKLYRTEGKAEIVDGRVIKLERDGCLPNQAKLNIQMSLHKYQKEKANGFVVGSLVAFIVDLPNRKSFSPDTSFFTGERAGMKFLQGAPIFAVEIRSENDYGKKADEAIKQKRHDYFAAGTKVVWDVDLLSEEVIKSYSSENPDTPQIFKRGKIANAEPALPDWTFEVDELFE